MTTESPANRVLSRRVLMGAVGATALGTIAAAGSASAGLRPLGVGDVAGAAQPQGVPRGENVPAPSVAYSYQVVGQAAFGATDPLLPRSISPTGAWAANSTLVASLVLPIGARVREVVAWVANSSVASADLVLVSNALDGGTGAPTTHATVAVPGNAAATPPITSASSAAAVDFIIDANRVYDIQILTSTTVRVYSVRIGYEPSVLSYVPVVPYRAYDSRLPSSPNKGVLAPKSTRTIYIRDAINGSGAVGTAGVIPANAKAITYNLTVDGATSSNWLAVAPGNATVTPSSAINFEGGQTISNAATVPIDAGNVKVFCGDMTGSPNILIDVTGYYI